MTYEQKPLGQQVNELESAARIAAGHADPLFATELELRADATRAKVLLGEAQANAFR